MTINKEESVILNKISVLVKKIQAFLTEVGCSDQQIAAYFGKKIFQSKASLKQKQTVQSFYERQIRAHLKQGKQKHGSLRVTLIHMLTKLQIENGQIEYYETELQQQKTSSKVLERRKELLYEEISYKPRRIFDMNLFKEEGQEGNKKIVRDLDQIKSFEKELQQSLMKTKLLKRLIQQRIEEDLEDPFNRCFNGFQKLLSLESSG